MKYLKNKKIIMKKIIITIISIFLLFSCSNQENIWENEEKPNLEKTIIALWDSLTAWYNLDINEAYPKQLEDLLKKNNYNYKIINAWVSWDTSKNLLDRMWIYDDIKADIYILAIWWNDWLRQLSIKDMKKNIIDIIKHLQEKNPDGEIVFAWMQMPINVWLEYSKDFKDAFFEIQKEEKLYFYEFLLEWVARDTSLNLSDWIHPNKDWYTIIAKNLYDFLEKEDLIEK